MPNPNAAAQAHPTLALASQSPRRRRMMQWLGIPVAITKVDIDETPLPGEPPRDLATRLARAKAQAAAHPSLSITPPDHATDAGDRAAARLRLHPDSRRGTRHDARAPRRQDAAFVLTADTVVDFDGVSLGKPADAAEARATLRKLRERPHQVHTGVALARIDGDTVTPFVRRVTTDVTMRPYTDAEIAAYIATGDPMDKAGAYAVQHDGFDPVARLHVCYANVVGLPLCAVVALLNQAGRHLDVDIPALCAHHFNYDCPCPDPGTQLA